MENDQDKSVQNDLNPANDLQKDNHDNLLTLPRLYKPNTVAELLTPETLRKLMLGFAAGLGGTVITITEMSGERYDLWGTPSKYWNNFCKFLRHDLGKDYLCVEWDRKVAEILLGKRPEEYSNQLAEYKTVFPCHAGMLDLAEVIKVAGKPLAVLQGGQLVPKNDPNWEKSVRKKLLSPPLNLTNKEVEEILLKALEKEEAVVTHNQLKEKNTLFIEFARELESLFNKLFNERRFASEEALLHMVTMLLHFQEYHDLDELWINLKDLFVDLYNSTDLLQIGWFMGDEKNRFHLKLMTDSVDDWKRKTLSIGSFWEEMKQSSGWIDGKRWDLFIRDGLNLDENSSCAIFPMVCSYGNPVRNIPSIFIAVSQKNDAHLLSNFLSRLSKEINREIIAVLREMENKKINADSAAMGAYVGHDIKTPLHIMANIIPALELQLKKSNLSDPSIEVLLEQLRTAMRYAQIKVSKLENLPVREVVIEPNLVECDFLNILNELINQVNSLGTERGISVVWAEQPKGLFYCCLDKMLIEVALFAVFDNAVKYSFANKKVMVWVKTKDDNCVELRITNLGIGIPPDRMIAIFEFGQRGGVEDKGVERTGTGLGLPFAKSIIESHNGTIEIYSHSTYEYASNEKDDFISHIVDVYIKLPLVRSK